MESIKCSKRRRVSPKQLDYLRQWYPKWRLPKLTEHYNKKFGTDKTTDQIRATCKNHEIVCGRSTGKPKGEGKYSKAQKDWLRRYYPQFSRGELLERFNRRFKLDVDMGRLKALLTNNKILCGRTGCFEKGHRPHNTGTKGVMKANTGTFRKGQKCNTVKPLGHRRKDKDGYWWVKVAGTSPYTGADGYYRMLHVINYEQATGETVPKSHCLIFKDGNRDHCEYENLELVSRAVLVRLNQIGEVPPELRETRLALARLRTRMGELKRGKTTQVDERQKEKETALREVPDRPGAGHAQCTPGHPGP